MSEPTVRNEMTLMTLGVEKNALIGRWRSLDYCPLPGRLWGQADRSDVSGDAASTCGVPGCLRAVDGVEEGEVVVVVVADVAFGGAGGTHYSPHSDTRQQP